MKNGTSIAILNIAIILLFAPAYVFGAHRLEDDILVRKNGRLYTKGEIVSLRSSREENMCKEDPRKAAFEIVKARIPYLKSSGLEFPQFGKWVMPMGVVSSEQNEFCSPRPMIERLEDYWHPCVLREPNKEVAEADIAAWKKRTFRKKDVENLRSDFANSLMKRVLELEDLLGMVIAECARYGVKKDSAASVAAITQILDTNSHLYWESAAKRGKAPDYIEKRLKQVEVYLSTKLSHLDKIHEAEFKKWCVMPENQAEFQRRQKEKEKRIQKGQELMAKVSNEVSIGLKLDRIAQNQQREAERNAIAMEEVKRRIQEAEWAAEDARRKAEEATRDAEAAAWENQRMKDDLRLNGVDIIGW